MFTRDQTPVETAGSRGALICPRCESALLVDRHCKTLCALCGYVESCEDNFIPTRDNPPEGAPPANNDASTA